MTTTVYKKDAFDELEDKGRLLFQGWCFGRPGCMVTKFAEKKSSPWDVAYKFIFTNKPIIGEIKVRDMSHNSFSTAFLEKSKLDALRTLKGTSDSLLHYICIYHDKVLIFDITQLDTSILESEDRWLPITTADGSKIKKLKTVYHLPITTALKQ